MAPYVPTVWVNYTAPALSAANLNKLTDELEAQALAESIPHTLPSWVDNSAPALTDATPLNEMERVCQLVAQAEGLTYIPTLWESGWTPARNATRLNRLEQQVTANRVAIDASPLPAFPATYFTGPLGANNVVPSTLDGALLGMWCGGGGYTEQMTRDWVQERMTTVGRSFDMVEHQLDQLTVSGVQSETWVHSQGSIPVVSWNPSYSMPDIVAGLADAELTAMAIRFRDKGFRIMWRPWHEFNGFWFLWSATVANSGTWKAAWVHAHDIFQSVGADNVGFVWTPTEGQPRDIRDACYPGDQYVDWVSTTSYNGCLGTQDFCTPLHGGWATFRELFDFTNLGSGELSTYSAYGHRKPFIPTETGSKYDPNVSGRKAQWMRDIDGLYKPLMPYLMGLCFFDQDVRMFEPNNDWRVSSGPIGVFSQVEYNGYIDFARTARWNVGAVGGAT